MTRQDLLFLQSKQEYPSVSLIVPFEATMTARKENVVRVNNAVKLAREQLEKKCLEHDVDAVMKNIENAVGLIDYEHTSALSVAIFANKEISSLYYLPVSVNPRVALSDTFEVRDVLYALQQVQAYWVLTLSEKPSRMFYGVLKSLSEIIEPAQDAQGNDVDGFPYSYLPPNVKTVHEMMGGTLHKDARYVDDCKEKFFERVFKLAKRFLDKQPLPLFVITTEKDRSLFERAANGYPIAGWVEGDYCKRQAHEIAAVVWPAIQAYAEQERKATLHYFEETAMGSASKHASGFDEVLRVAKEGRVHELLIEADLEQDGSGDPINELIELVLSKGNARVVFYPKDALKKYAGIAAVLRY